MGYRSDVAVVIYGDHRDPDRYELLKTLMNTTLKDVYTELDSNAEWHDNPAGVLEFKIDDVKWYESYPDVQRFMDMLDKIGEIAGFNYEFVRVGEEVEDIENKSEGQCLEYLISVTRSIRVDL